MQDTQTTINKYDALLTEFVPHTLDDARGTVLSFSYSPGLVEFMRENEITDPTEARDLIHFIIEDLLNELTIQ